ncbi:zinc finger C2H2 type [Schistosoma japonicum]|uniref:Zinc finger C2H2 type n=1 Tax=Schistosoma japonicum TaxID=6182 RepID=A0A4Z2D9J8_SCHJA|nr:zinc finger C2H2 type [Schistosoma japonicum]
MSKDESQKSIIDSLRIQSNGLNPLLSAQHYYMMALAANFPSSSNSLFSPPEVLAKSNFMQTFSTSLDIPFLSVPPPDLNNITLQEAQCDQCQKVFCNEYFLQLHSLSHQNNLNESTLRNEKERLNVMENVSTEKEDIDKLNKKDSNTDKSNMDIEANDNGDCDSQRNNQEKTKKKETDSFLFLLNKSNNSDVNMNYLENSELRLNTHSLDAFKSSMVAAKLADRVTCELCNKELCNKYFLRTHKIRVHGISPKEVGGPPMRNPPTIENSTFSCSLNDLHATNCITNSHEINSMLNFGENGKMETALSDDMLNSFNSAYSTLGLVNQFLPFAYWPFFAACNFMPEQAGSYPLDKSLLSNLDNVATWNNLNSSIMNDICSYTSPTISNNSNKNPDLTEIPSAITSICCPLCDLPIGPRLFLPTHLSSVHKLSPTDPDFFMNMLRAKPLSKTEKVTDTKVFDHWPSINPKSINVGFQEECTMNNIHQPDIADLAKGCISSSDKNKEQIDVNNCPDNLILKEFKSYGQKMELKAISNESTSITSDIMNVKSMDIDLHAETMKSQPISSKELSSNDITQYLSTNTSSMNSISFLPVNQVNTLETTINDSHTTGLSLAPVSSTISSRDSLINYASTTTSSFSSLPINPIASMTEVSATGDPISSRSWNMMTHLSINNHSNNQSTMNQLSAEVSPTSSLGNISNSVAQSSIPRKSPNQMRVLCDICNKWICNKYFLRTHKANKHGVTDLSLGSLENHRSGIEKSVTTMKSNIHTSFRRAMNHYVRGSSQGDDKVINNYSNSNRKLNSPCDSQVSFRNSCMTSKQERQTHNTEQIITNNDFLTGTSLTNISATTDISGTINSLPLSFQTTVATHLPWLSYGFPHQPTSLVSYPTMNYPSILSFPMIPNSDIYPYSQMDIAEKLETTESNVHNSESNKISADTESENEENKDKHTKEIEDSQINLPANTCETQQNNTKNIATSPQYSMDRFRKTSNYHHQLNRLQRKKHRKMKTTKSYYVTTETPSKQFYSQTTHKDIINNACNLYNEIQLHENNPSMNDENCPTEINKI